MNLDNDPRSRETGEYVSFSDQVSKFYETEPRVRVRVEVAGRTDPGKVRPNNEDHFLVVRRYRGREVLTSSLPDGSFEPAEDHAYTLAVADGMGGRNFGEVASLLALRTGWELGGDEIKWSVKMNEREVHELRQKAEVFFRLVDQSLHAEIRENPRLSGMGTTLTICYSTGPNLFVMHAGDSRAYLFRAGALTLLTRDHNLGQILVDAGKAEPGSPLAKRMHHVLTNVLGGPTEHVDVDIDHLLLADGDRVLLCTDGLTDLVADDEIARVIETNAAADDACRALVDRALEHGGTDNVTVVIANYRLDDEM
jgi:protein phosphatase